MTLPARSRRHRPHRPVREPGALRRALAPWLLAVIGAVAPLPAAAQAGTPARPAPPMSPASGPSSAAVPAFKEVDSIEARVQGCVTCHGQQGQGTSNGYFPRIAGKPAGYLYHQLVAFRDGTRHYRPMNYLVAYLPDAYLREIATWFSRQRPPYAPRELDPVDGTVLARGERLARDGDPGKGIPACMACHGDALTGMEPGIPGLVGLRPNYVVAQLTRWKVGERHATAPDCMRRVAGRLSEDDITAVAAWLARQAPAPDTPPLAANLVRMPLACGSQQ